MNVRLNVTALAMSLLLMLSACATDVSETDREAGLPSTDIYTSIPTSESEVQRVGFLTDHLISLDELETASKGTDVRVVFAKWYAPDGGIATSRPDRLTTPSEFANFVLDGKKGIAEGSEREAREFLEQNAQMFSLSAYESDEDVRALVKFSLQEQRSIEALSNFTSATPTIYGLALEGSKEELGVLAKALNVTKFVEVDARGRAFIQEPDFIRNHLELNTASLSPQTLSTDEYLKFEEIAAEQYGIELGEQ